MIVKLTVSIDPQDSKGVGIVEFYDRVAAALGLDPDILCYDCTKIHVSKNIQSNIFAMLDSQSSDPCYTGTMWCLRGPKSFEELPDDTVELLDGFFVRNKMPLSFTMAVSIDEVA